jgi:hypothetical protein
MQEAVSADQGAAQSQFRCLVNHSYKNELFTKIYHTLLNTTAVQF